MEDTPASLFTHEHRKLDTQLQAHLLALVGGDLPRALRALERWWAALSRHLEIEETRLFPQIPEGARWSSRLYRREHDRIRLLAAEYMQLVNVMVSHPPIGETARRAAVLALLDAVHPLRHLLRHHSEREETALAEELPVALLSGIRHGR